MPCMCYYEPSESDKKIFKMFCSQLVELIKILQKEGNPAGCSVKWEPIETAPKDGTEVLLFDGKEGEVYLGRWIDNSKKWCPLSSEMEVGFWSDNVSHWMKIPKVPVKITEWKRLGMCCEKFWDCVKWEEGKKYYIEDIPHDISFCPWCGKDVKEMKYG